MPFLSDSRDITVSSSRLIDIGRDHITVNIIIGLHDLPAALNLPIVFQGNAITTHYSKATSSSDITTGLIIETVQSLMGLHSPNGYRGLKLRLESLQKTVESLLCDQIPLLAAPVHHLLTISSIID
jgi:hypothetical protein